MGRELQRLKPKLTRTFMREAENEHERADQGPQYEYQTIPGSSPLLDLPGEMRNAVWRNVVFEWAGQRTIDIDRHYMPRIMFISKHLFNEVGHIWHNKIQFTVAIQSFKFQFSLQALQRIWTKVPPQDITLDLQGVFSWSNLRNWLQAYHEGAIGGTGYDPALLDDRKDSRTLSLMFDAVKAVSSVPWRTVEAALENDKEMLAIADPVWKRRFGVQALQVVLGRGSGGLRNGDDGA